MLKVSYRTQFKKELKQQEKRGKDPQKFLDVAKKLANKEPLDPKYNNHKLVGNSQQNPAYPEYCRLMGIDPNERDVFVLLSTIGRKGPSSFMFSPLFERNMKPEDLIKFRESLGLTTREFAKVFEFSQPSLNALERGRTSGKDILKRLEILLNFPAVALDFLIINGGHLIYDKWIAAVEYLKEKGKGGS